MKHVLILVVAVGLLAATASTATAGERPGWDYVNEVWTFPGYPNPCTGELDDVTLTIEGWGHFVEHPNGGGHYNDVLFAALSTSSGWSMDARNAFPVRENYSDGRYVLTETQNWMINGPDGGKWRQHYLLHIVQQDGELQLIVEDFEDVCVKAPTA